MATYVVLSRISPQAFADPAEFKEIAACGVSQNQERLSQSEVEG